MSEIESYILKRLKQKKGCSLTELAGGVFSAFQYTDANQSLTYQGALEWLLAHDFVEAYDKNSNLVPKELLEGGGKSWDNSLTFYMSSRAAYIEDVLGISLTANSIFGRPVQGKTWPQVFVLMPFATKHRPIYTDHISVVCKNLGLTVGRADDFFSTGSVMADVWSAINFATVLIADCTDRNPNVFYEIGVAHTVGKDTILISQSVDDIPFDLRHLRTIIFEYTPPGMAQFEKTLSATLKQLYATLGLSISPKRILRSKPKRG